MENTFQPVLRLPVSPGGFEKILPVGSMKNNAVLSGERFKEAPVVRRCAEGVAYPAFLHERGKPIYHLRWALFSPGDLTVAQ